MVRLIIGGSPHSLISKMSPERAAHCFNLVCFLTSWCDWLLRSSQRSLASPMWQSHHYVQKQIKLKRKMSFPCGRPDNAFSWNNDFFLINHVPWFSVGKYISTVKQSSEKMPGTTGPPWTFLFVGFTFFIVIIFMSHSSQNFFENINFPDLKFQRKKLILARPESAAVVLW